MRAPTIPRGARAGAHLGCASARGPRVRRTGRGASAVETAAVLPVVLAVVLLLVWLLSLAAAHVRVVDAAREAARVAARGDGVAVAQEGASRIAPTGAVVRVRVEGDTVRARVVARVQGPGGLLAFLPSPEVEAEAVAAREEE